MPKPKNKRKMLKAYEIKDLEVEFASVVDLGANMKKWVMFKDAKGKIEKKEFDARSPLLKSADNFGIEKIDGFHLAIAPLLEPFAEDAHGDFQTAETIKTAFQKSDTKIDVMHNEVEQSEETIKLAKQWLLDEDWNGEDINGNPMELKKGTWMTAMHVAEGSDLATGINDGTYTGLSAGGYLERVYEDVTVEEVESNFLNKMIKFFGGNPSKMEKGALLDKLTTYDDSSAKLDAAEDARWIWGSEFWDKIEEGDFDGIVEATEDFLTYLKSLDSEGKSTLQKSFEKMKKNKGGMENMGMTEEEVKKLIKAESEENKKVIEDLQKKLDEKETNEATEKEAKLKKELLTKGLEVGLTEEEIKGNENTELMKKILMKKGVEIENASDSEIEVLYKFNKDISFEAKPKLEKNLSEENKYGVVIG